MEITKQSLLKPEFMPHDRPVQNTARRIEGIRKAAREREAAVDLSIKQAMREIDAEGKRVDFTSVARRAGVSRQSIYNRKDVAQEIEALRKAFNTAPGTKRPVSERATEESVKARLYVLSDENKRLKAEIADLRKRLAEMLGEQRQAKVV